MKNLSSDLQQVLEQAVNEASNLHTVLSTILTKICEFTKWDYGEVWIPCQKGTILELYSAFYITSDRNDSQVRALEQFHICTKGFTFPSGVGLPGRVWLSQKAEWLPNASAVSERVFLRNQIAQAFGVKTGFGVPIVAHDQVLGILVFFMLDACEEDKQLTEMITTTTEELGDKLENLFKEEDIIHLELQE